MGGLRLKPGMPYRLDAQGFKIEGGVDIVDIINESINATGWTKIEVPRIPDTEHQSGSYGVACKAIYVKMRDNSPWKLSHRSDGATYVTISRGLSINIGKIAGDTLFYARTVSGTGTLEVMLLD